jgi:hypothetical protein
MGGTKAKPFIQCANKECGYRRDVVHEEPAPEPVAASAE